MQANFFTRCLLAFGSCAGGPIDPQDIEDTLRVMNETKIEVILEKGDSPLDLPPLTTEAPFAPARQRAP